jgi:uncharacterized protein
MRKRLMNYWLVILAVFVLMALWLRWREPSMIYYPTREIEQTPDSLGWKFEDVCLTTSDGVRINGWFVPAPQSPVTTHHSPLTILFLHGNAGNISHRIDKLAILRELGADVFIIDYRGYGRSEGVPNEQGTYRDAQAAYDHLTQTLNREPRTIVVYGESLGSAVAVDLAAKHTVGAVIIEESFTSIADVGQKMFPFMPVRLLVRNKYDTLSKIGRVNAPLLIFHSRDDEFFSWRHAERLFAAAREPKQLVELHGGHNDAFLASAAIYRTGLRDFLARLR